VRLQVVLPTKIELDDVVRKVVAEGPEGSFCVLPRHQDLVTPLTVGLLAYEDEHGEHFLGLGGGLLVKQGRQIRIATPFVVAGVPLGELRREAQRRAQEQDQQDRQARTAVGRMEADLVRRFMELRRGR
jgi:F-type H+-transporting ATPase subunit epsilon